MPQTTQTDTWKAALSGREDLAKYGDNRLLLFALALHQDVDDLELLANDILTDGANDKKCDLVYVNPERGQIIVAQGYWAKGDRAEAPANKASDLNTALTWLLGGETETFPEALRNAAEQVRSSLANGEASTIHIWYVHNLPESENVRRELSRVEATCDSLVRRLFPSAQVESILSLEVGTSTLENWYRGTQAPILVTDRFDFETRGGFSTNGENWSAYSTSVPAAWLRSMFEKHGRDLFSANVRDYLGSRRSDKNINNNIKRTARDSPEMFWVYNNGITALVNDFIYTSEDDLGVLQIYGIAIVNGAQTTGALGTIENAPLDNALVPARFVKCSDPETIANIIRYNNSQNKIEATDFRSNDSTQTRLTAEFAEFRDVNYAGGRRGGQVDSIRRPRNSISSYTVGQALVAFHGDPTTAYNQRSGIWQSDKIYSSVFNEHTTAHHIVFVYSLLKAVDESKAKLRQLGDTNRTDAQTRQWNSLRLRGATFLMTAAVAAGLEVILGRPIPNRFELGFYDTPTLGDAAARWARVLAVTTPLVGRLSTALEQGNLKNKAIVQKALNDFVDVLASVRDSNQEIFDQFSEHVKQ